MPTEAMTNDAKLADEPSIETRGWAWLTRLVESMCDEAPEDIAYSADQMVDAFMAGHALRTQPNATSAREDALRSAAQSVLAERARQVEAEGWTPEHDDAHGDGAIAAAAGCYALNAARPWGSERDLPMNAWPWDARWWKPGSATPEGKRRDLVKAGALILAEIERLDRLAFKPGAPNPIDQSDRAAPRI